MLMKYFLIYFNIVTLLKIVYDPPRHKLSLRKTLIFPPTRALEKTAQLNL